VEGTQETKAQLRILSVERSAARRAYSRRLARQSLEQDKRRFAAKGQDSLAQALAWVFRFIACGPERRPPDAQELTKKDE
jgi:hypothetical protein